MRLTVAPLAAVDVGDLARLHRRAFPRFFLSTLGEPFLVQFYRGFLDDESAVTVVARDQLGQITGVVVGTIQPDRFFSRLLRRRWWGFALASARTALTSPGAVQRLLGALRYRGDTPTGGEGALLSSICVDPANQGTGVGRRLVEAWLSEVAAHGVRTAYLTTDADHNDAVNAFYQTSGWRLADTFTTRTGRRMHQYTISLDEVEAAPC